MSPVSFPFSLLQKTFSVFISFANTTRFKITVDPLHLFSCFSSAKQRRIHAFNSWPFFPLNQDESAHIVPSLKCDPGLSVEKKALSAFRLADQSRVRYAAP